MDARASNTPRANEQANSLRQLVREVPIRKVQPHRLPEQRLAHADKQTGYVKCSGGEGCGLAGGGDGPDEGADRDGGGRVDRFGEKCTGDGENDVGYWGCCVVEQWHNK